MNVSVCEICNGTGTDYLGRDCRRCYPTVMPNTTDTFAAAIGLLAARHHLGGTALEDAINEMTADEVRAALLAQTIVAGLLLRACCTHDGIDVTTALTTMGLHNQTITSTKGDTP